MLGKQQIKEREKVNEKKTITGSYRASKVSYEK